MSISATSFAFLAAAVGARKAKGSRLQRQTEALLKQDRAAAQKGTACPSIGGQNRRPCKSRRPPPHGGRRKNFFSFPFY